MWLTPSLFGHERANIAFNVIQRNSIRLIEFQTFTNVWLIHWRIEFSCRQFSSSYWMCGHAYVYDQLNVLSLDCVDGVDCVLPKTGNSVFPTRSPNYVRSHANSKNTANVMRRCIVMTAVKPIAMPSFSLIQLDFNLWSWCSKWQW